MVETLIGVVVGYALAYVPKISVVLKTQKNGNRTEKKMTDKEKREAERLMREYNNFLAYDGTEQQDVIV
jgi:hypothetical protein